MFTALNASTTPLQERLERAARQAEAHARQIQALATRRDPMMANVAQMVADHWVEQSIRLDAALQRLG